jgi:hypothetical protein
MLFLSPCTVVEDGLVSAVAGGGGDMLSLIE